jgi:opacity protein-like surface antigen
MTRNLNYAFALALVSGIAGLTATPASADESNTTRVEASAADYDDGPQVYVKAVAGNVTETTAEADFIPEVPPAETETIELDGGALFGAAAGVDFGYLRFEAGVDRSEAELSLPTATIDFGFFEFTSPDTLETDSTTWHVTAYGELPLGDSFTAFGGLGLDYVETEANLAGQGVSGDGDGWHYEVGGAYEVADGITLEASYRVTSANIEFDDDFDVETESQALRAGVRFTL